MNSLWMRVSAFAFLVLLLLAGLVLVGDRVRSDFDSVRRAAWQAEADIQAQPRVIMVSLDPSLDRFNRMWADEIGRRFDNALGIIVHGGDFVEGEWIVGAHFRPDIHITPMSEIIERYRKLYPNRAIILLACNTGHVTLTGYSNTFYFKNSVWCVPDRAITPEMTADAYTKLDGAFAVGFAEQSRWSMEPDINGNIFEAVEAR